MSNYDINSNPALVKLMIENEKKEEEEYRAKYPDSLTPHFEQELRELGYEFEVPSQIIGFMPKHKETILPIAIRYYQNSEYKNEKNYFMGFFNFIGFEEVIPMLLEDFYSDNQLIDRWAIGSILYTICSKNYTSDYLRIISNPQYGINRQMVVLLMGKLKIEDACPTLIRLLDDDDVKLHAVCALADYKKEEFRPQFERLIKDDRSVVRKHAKLALKRLDSVKN